MKLSTVVFKTLHNIMDSNNDSVVASSIISLTAHKTPNTDGITHNEPTSVQFSDEKPVTFDLKQRKVSVY